MLLAPKRNSFSWYFPKSKTYSPAPALSLSSTNCFFSSLVSALITCVGLSNRCLGPSLRTWAHVTQNRPRLPITAGLSSKHMVASKPFVCSLWASLDHFLGPCCQQDSCDFVFCKKIQCRLLMGVSAQKNELRQKKNLLLSKYSMLKRGSMQWIILYSPHRTE